MKNKIKNFLLHKMPRVFRIVRSTKRRVTHICYYLFYRGENTYCICCDKKLRNFKYVEPLDIGINANVNQRIEHNISCPYCGSGVRHRAECYLLLKGNIYKYRSWHSIILFAPEYCIECFLTVKGIAYRTSDLYREDCDYQFDLCNIDLPDNSQDLLICNHVLEHVPDDRKAIFELNRILRVGGVLLVTVPLNIESTTTKEEHISCDKERKKQYGHEEHLRLYGLDFTDKLSEYFDVEIFNGSYIDNVSMPEFGTNSSSYNVVYICKKL